jgi:hypothetical protein
MVARGYSSETFTFEAIESRECGDRLYVIYYLGDFHRAEQDAARLLEEKLERFAREKGVDVAFVHLAIEGDDIFEFDDRNQRALVYLASQDERWLPTRDPKRNSAADKARPNSFAIELDAIEADDLRAVVQGAIEQRLPPDQLELLKIAEEGERELIAGLVAKIAKDWRA